MGITSLLTALKSDDRVENVLAARAAAVASAWNARRSDPKDDVGRNHFIEPRFLVRKEACEGSSASAEERFLDQSQREQLDEKLAGQWREAFQPLGDPTDDGPTRLEKLHKLGNRIVITEDAGAGKSIFTHWAIAWLSTQDAWRRMNDRGLPILAVRFERDNEKWPLTWEGYLGELACKLAKHCPGAENWNPGESVPKIAEDVTKRALREGRVVIFCDALDQIVGAEAQKQLEAFWSFLGQLTDNYPGVKIVVTSRATAVQKHAGRFKAPWKHAIVAGFSAIEQVQYLADLIPNSVLSEDVNVADLSEMEAVELLSHERLLGEFHAEVADLLQTPVILSIVRSIAEKDSNNRGEFPRFSNRADLYFQATSRLLNRNLEKREQLSDSGKSELREALSATAFAMMILEAGSYAVRGESEMERLSKLARSYASPELKAKWSDVWEKLQQIADVSHRLIVEEKSNDFFGWKHKGMMEFYAGLFLAKNELPAWKQSEIRIEDHLENEHRLTDLLAKSHWHWVVRFAIELPQAESGAAQTFADIPTLRRTLASLFALPNYEIRPTELMYRAWALFQWKDEKRQGSASKYLETLQSEGLKILASFQQQFMYLLTEGKMSKALIAAQLVPKPVLKELVKSQSRFAKLYQVTDKGEAFVRCPPNGDSGVFWMGTHSSKNVRESGKERPRHPVRVAPFWMQSTSVTVEQFSLFDPAFRKWGENSVYFKKYASAPDCPVIMTNYFDASMFALWTGNSLPTEAQREFAARAGHDGIDELFGVSNYNGRFDQITNQIANIGGDYPSTLKEVDRKPIETKFVYAETTLPVRWTAERRASFTLKKTRKPPAFAPNDWGLWQMQGNLWEWCSTIFDGNAYTERVRRLISHPDDASLSEIEEALSNISLPDSNVLNEQHIICGGASRVLRGGSWYAVGHDCRVALRVDYSPVCRDVLIGFRLSRCFHPPSRP